MKLEGGGALFGVDRDSPATFQGVAFVTRGSKRKLPKRGTKLRRWQAKAAVQVLLDRLQELGLWPLSRVAPAAWGYDKYAHLPCDDRGHVRLSAIFKEYYAPIIVPPERTPLRIGGPRRIRALPGLRFQSAPVGRQLAQAIVLSRPVALPQRARGVKPSRVPPGLVKPPWKR